MTARALYLTAGLSLALAALAWTALVFNPDSPVPAFDRICALHWRDQQASDSFLWSWMVLLTDLGGVAGMILLTVMGALWQWSIGQRRLALAWIAIAASGAVLNQAIKIALDRSRPSPEWRDRAVLETNQSYPSGHAMGSTIGYGMLAYLLARRARPRCCVAVVLFLAALVGAIGLSRIYLRAHWFSDVIGGVLVGLSWLCLCWWLLERRGASDLERSGQPV
jgi:membrane-associated phospholipid phosphatase